MKLSKLLLIKHKDSGVTNRLIKSVLKKDNVLSSAYGYIRDDKLATIEHNMWLLAPQQDIRLQVVHILGRQNDMAGLLSRWKSSDVQIQQLQKLVLNPN